MDTYRKGKYYSTVNVAVLYDLKAEALRLDINMTKACIKGLEDAVVKAGGKLPEPTESDPDVKV
jgi:hypothetical protein